MSRQAPGAVALPPRRRYYHRCSCGRMIPEGVMRCSARTCPEFAPTWARDTRRRLLENLRIVPATVMFSVTAPGTDLYPFDSRFCAHRPVTRCSGRIGCRVDPELAGAFNRQAGQWWSQLHRAAKVRADRQTGHKGKLLARAWEKQKRGLAHLHGVIAVDTPLRRAWGKAYVDALRDLAPRYGFGYVDGWEKIIKRGCGGQQAARYLSSYLVDTRGKKASLTETAADKNLPRLLVFVSRELTSRTGCTMRNLRVARRLWASREGLAEPPTVSLSEWLAAASLLRVRTSMTRAP
jgi:hypothetical protein